VWFDVSESLVEPLKELFLQVQKTFNVETVIGKPLVFEDKTIIPIVKVGFGAGGGGGGGGQGGSGVGLGGGVEPIALLLILSDVPGKDGVHLIELKPKGKMGVVLAQMLPQIMEMFGKRKPSEKQQEEKKKLMEI